MASVERSRPCLSCRSASRIPGYSWTGTRFRLTLPAAPMDENGGAHVARRRRYCLAL